MDPALKKAADSPLLLDMGTKKGLSAATKNILSALGLLLTDLLAVICSILVAYLARKYLLPLLFPAYFVRDLAPATMPNLWWMPLLLLTCLAYEELYQKRLPYWKEVEKILKAVTLAVIFAIALLYLAKLSAETSRTLVVITWLGTILFVPFFRYYGKLNMIKLGLWNKPIIILGAGKTGELMVKALTREKTLGYQVMGFIDDRYGLEKTVAMPGGATYPVLGTFAQAKAIISSTGVQEILVAAPGMPAKQLVALTNQLQSMVNSVMVVPDLFGLSMNGIELEYFFDEQALLLNIKNKLKSPLNQIVKRTFDILAGLTILLLSLPLMLLIILAIRLDSKGPALYLQERLGQKSNIFTCYKFRTMYLDADKLLARHLNKDKMAQEEWTTYNKLKDYDPRVTRVGDFLRRFSLDELPQLINVILGDMSLVGPRPYLPRERKQMSHWIHDIHVAKPGITGLWQVSGRNDVHFKGRLQLDAWYVRNWSLWLDIILLIKTIRVVLNRKGAY